MSEKAIEAIEAIMADFDEKKQYSPYKVGKVLSGRIGAIPPQMVYNYISAGYLPERRNSTEKLFLTFEDIEAFVAKIVQSRSEKAKKADKA